MRTKLFDGPLTLDRKKYDKKLLDRLVGERYVVRSVIDYRDDNENLLYKGVDCESMDDVVLKFFHPALRDDEEYARSNQRMLNEIYTLNRLDHEGIVKTYPSFEFEGAWVLVVEYLPNECEDYFYGRTSDDLFFPRVLQFMDELGSAVQYLVSEEVAHRDVKHENILVSREGKLKLIDFGIATDKKNSQDVHLSPFYAIGTIEYMPPEGISGSQAFSPHYDIYGVGLNTLMLVYNQVIGIPLHNMPDNDITAVYGMGFFERQSRLIDVMLERITEKCPPELVSLMRKSTASRFNRVTADEFMEELNEVKRKWDG